MEYLPQKMHSKPMTGEVIREKKYKEDFVFISMQDKPSSYAVGAQLCIVGFRGQILAFLPHSAFCRETKPKNFLVAGIKESQRS